MDIPAEFEAGLKRCLNTIPDDRKSSVYRRGEDIREVPRDAIEFSPVTIFLRGSRPVHVFHGTYSFFTNAGSQYSFFVHTNIGNGNVTLECYSAI